MGLCIVSKKESQKVPYSYVMVLDDWTFRELDGDENKYLDSEFEFGDGARPYVKSGLYETIPEKGLAVF